MNHKKWFQYQGVLVILNKKDKADAIMGKEESHERTIDKTNALLMESLSRDAKRAVVVLDEVCKNADWLNSEEDFRKFAITVHGIKSALKNAGESALAEAASFLEQAGRDKRNDLVASSAPVFLKDLHTLIEEIDAMQSSSEDDAGEDSPDLPEKLLAISTQCEEYNRRGVLNLIAEIEHCSPKTREFLKEIKELAMQSDFEDAEKAIAVYISELREQ